MSQRVNDFQTKMKDVTRQMMATVSELSMYQATAFKLEEEAGLLRDASSEARTRRKVFGASFGEGEFFLRMGDGKTFIPSVPSYRKNTLPKPGLEEQLPPTRAAEEEFQKSLRQERFRALEDQAIRARRAEEEVLLSNATRTTAEPRVNAYIPEGEFGLPKAYGNYAPYMPSQGGSTMRHIRNPNPRPIEI